MFESEQAAKSRLQFISQLAGSTAGLSMLAACGGGGLVDSRGNALSTGSGEASESTTPLMPGPLVDTPEIQKIMFKTNIRGITHPSGVGVLIRDDFKNNTSFVNKLNQHQALVTLDNKERGKKVKPKELCSPPCYGGGDGWYGEFGYYGWGYTGYLPNFEPISGAYITPYGGQDPETLGLGAFIYYPNYFGSPTYWTEPVQWTCIDTLETDANHIITQIEQYCHENPGTCAANLSAYIALYQAGHLGRNALIARAVAALGLSMTGILEAAGVAIGLVALIYLCVHEPL